MTSGEPKRLWLAALALLVAFALVSLAVGSTWSPVLRLDRWLSDKAFAATYGHDGRVAAWRAVTDWGGPGPMRWLLAAAGVVAAIRRRVDVALWLVGLAVVEGIVAPSVKDLFDRARPVWDDPITVLASTSYPSGHATAAATAAVALALAVRRTAVTCCVVAVALGVAASRVFLGAHYLSDVVGGLLLGALLATTSYALLRTVTPSRSPRSLPR
ncbi:undecaprenyl-diphosphatase [Nocardioides sp. BE266]|uniref:phosphatase PAP2 family protein n=1 Tax=Nocardioides sp. BE266 TaxID=2817725 RepID=UPI00285E5E94|nr:phosphatase PAP2 family protein [Nocardioides sp. BE266]MDR7254785.1 undecaprenyl-diphosphatase [Nocardioides sp. BE266]